jgi:hypothetical protein
MFHFQNRLFMRQTDPFFYIPSVVAPAPWHLKGNGYVFLFRHSRSFLQENAFLNNYQKEHLIAGLGAVMLVDYQLSDVGPYQELIYIPGIFKFAGHYAFTISKTYVSSQDSRWNGVENWGIPKEVADFSFMPGANGRQDEEWIVSRDGTPFFSVRLHRYGWKFPVSSALVPFRIGQNLRDSLLITEPAGKGKGQLVRSSEWFSDPNYFPIVEPSSLLMGMALRDFALTFPKPRMFRAG